MKRLMSLFDALLADASRWCDTSTHRDFRTITMRVEHEGLSFLTIALPSYCQDFERALDIGKVDPSHFAGFSRCGAFPRFLGGLLDRVFNSADGCLLENPDINAIFYVRQICLLAKKIRIECTESRKRKAVTAYLKSNADVADQELSYSSDILGEFGKASFRLFGSVLLPLEVDCYERTLKPAHGPGATADRLVGNGKFKQNVWTERLEQSFPSELFLIPNCGYVDRLKDVAYHAPGQEEPVRVILVPKTLKTPRVIAMEPTCMQYAQQSIAKPLMRLLESPKMHGSLGFTNQLRNRELAMTSSSDQSLATLDLKEASDRVSNLLVNTMFARLPSLCAAVQACRSLRANVPGNGVQSISRFASMGSALCFPIESMVFLTVLYIAWQRWTNRYSRSDVDLFLKSVRVYGDDIIIPTDMVSEALRSLTAYGFVVNRHKSFWNGKFRESCGGDFYDGIDVSVGYCRSPAPQSARCATELASWSSLRNNLYNRGCWSAARYLDTMLKEIIPYPIVLPTSPALGRFSHLPYQADRLHPYLHQPQVKAVVLRPRKRYNPLSECDALLKFFLSAGKDPSIDEDHLVYSGRPLSVYTKRGWANVT